MCSFYCRCWRGRPVLASSCELTHHLVCEAPHDCAYVTGLRGMVPPAGLALSRGLYTPCGERASRSLPDGPPFPREIIWSMISLRDLHLASPSPEETVVDWMDHPDLYDTSAHADFWQVIEHLTARSTPTRRMRGRISCGGRLPRSALLRPGAGRLHACAGADTRRSHCLQQPGHCLS